MVSMSVYSVIDNDIDSDHMSKLLSKFKFFNGAPTMLNNNLIKSNKILSTCIKATANKLYNSD